MSGGRGGRRKKNKEEEVGRERGRILSRFQFIVLDLQSHDALGVAREKMGKPCLQPAQSAPALKQELLELTTQRVALERKTPTPGGFAD